MILTLTPNPTVDRVLFLRDFQLGATLRAEREVVTPSGKGVDASLVIAELGTDTVAIGLQAGHNGRLLTRLLNERGIRNEFVTAQGETRIALVLIDLAVNQQSTITVPTLQATPEHVSQLLALLEAHSQGAWGVICAGSLPLGVPSDTYVGLLRRAHSLGLTTLLDSSGAALREGIAGQPDILKVNLEEARSLDPTLQGDPMTLGDTVGLVEKLIPRLGQWARDAVIVSLGGLGAVAVTRTCNYFVRSPEVPWANRAGAGDALGAGVMLARSQGTDWPAALTLGIAAAASVVMNEGTAICKREQVAELVLQVEIMRSPSGSKVRWKPFELLATDLALLTGAAHPDRQAEPGLPTTSSLKRVRDPRLPWGL